MNDLRRKIIETQYKSIELRKISLNLNLSKDVSLELRKKQDLLNNKYDFFKKLNNAIKKEKK